MAELGANRWGKSAVRVSKVIRGGEEDGFLDVEVAVLLTGDVEAAYIRGDNSAVLPTDTTKNTIYALARDNLTEDLERFGAILGEHMVEKGDIRSAEVTIRQLRWQREGPKAFTGGTERRVARVETDVSGVVSNSAGIEGLAVLKTGGSAFTGFPRDEYTTLPEAEDRLLATSVNATWDYADLPVDTTGAWERARQTILDRFFEDWSASVQHQGWMMASAVLEAIPEMTQISFELPNQHHLPVDLSPFGIVDTNFIFHPVSEPYGDIRFTVVR